MTELVINDENFHEYFFDVRKHKPTKGQTMACFTFSAELVDSADKSQLIDLLRTADKGISAVQFMKKIFHASHADSMRIPREICQDLLDGMTKEEVLQKRYKYTGEMYFYAKPEHVPDSPHWSTISILNLDQFTKSETI